MTERHDLNSFALSEVFTYLFIMLGPIKLLAPFVKLTAGCDPGERRSVALQGIAIATLTVLAAGFVGCAMLQKWHVGTGSLAVAGGLLFLLVALPLVLDPYTRTASAEAPPKEAPPKKALVAALVPRIVSPYGIAAVTLILTLMPQSYVPVVGILVGIMVLDFVAMLIAARIVGLLALPLQIVGTVMGVLQVALSVQMIVYGIMLIATKSFGFRLPG